MTYSSYPEMRPRCPCSRCGIVQGRSEPVKAVCDRRATAPAKLRSERTREDDLDRTCPAKVMAAIGSMGRKRQDRRRLSVSNHRYAGRPDPCPGYPPRTPGSASIWYCKTNLITNAAIQDLQDEKGQCRTYLASAD